VGQDAVGVGLRHREGVDHAVRRERPELVRGRGEVPPVGVQMRALRQAVGLGLAAVHEHDLVAACQQLRHDPPADEPRTTEHQDPHPVI
jgi:hypothetical protein